MLLAGCSPPTMPVVTMKALSRQTTCTDEECADRGHC
jgi:hypothetical protein